MTRIDYIILYVTDLEASVNFYRDVVGLPFKLWGDGYAEFATEGTRFALFDRSRLKELIGSRDASGEIALVVSDVDAEADRLRRAGAEILSGPQDRPWGHRTLHVAGPDGHVVELAQKIPRTTAPFGTSRTRSPEGPGTPPQ